jgi:sugar phosphate permease
MLSKRWASLILVLLSGSYLFVLFHRLSLAVLSRPISNEVLMTQADLGLIGAAYFYPYALMQVPAGLIADKYGTRLTLGCALAIMALGCFMFGSVRAVPYLVLGRGLIGFSCALVTVPVMKAVRETFFDAKLGIMTGIVNAAGNVGGVAASVPLSIAVSVMSWRSLYCSLGIAAIVMGLAMILVLPRPPKQNTKRPGDPVWTWRTIAPILRHPRIWLLAVWMLMFTGTKLAFQGLWAGAFLSSTYGPGAGSWLLLALSLGTVAGSPLVGILSDKAPNRRLVLLGATLMVTVMWGVLWAYPYRMTWIAAVSFYLIFGVAFASYNLCIMESRDICPLWLTGTVNGIISSVGFMGSAILTQLLGLLYSTSRASASSAAGFRGMFLLNAVLLGVMAVALTWYEVRTIAGRGPEQ